nr:DnaB-like helicase C-terminal domain-containing protein [Caldilineaceae bacterium]
IKDSGQVEQDADLIISLWEKDPPVAGMKKQVIQADIIKNRHGPKIPGSLLFDKPHFTFYDMEKQHTA